MATHSHSDNRDRALVLSALGGLAVSAWVYLFWTAGPQPDAILSGGVGWGPGELMSLFVMWVTMMAAMMLPSAIPVFLVYMAARQRRGGPAPLPATLAFAGGYLAVWTGFGAAAALTHYGLHSTGLLSFDGVRLTPTLGGIVLLLAGGWQWTPVKTTCLTHCRSPDHFAAVAWPDGNGGAFRMGARHGVWCLGCCWLLMGVLFVAGVMNLLWVAAVSALILVEKVALQGPRLGRLWGVLLIVAGAWLLGR